MATILASFTRTETNTVTQAAQGAFEQNSGGNTTYYATAGGAAAAGLAAAAGVFYFRKGKTATAEVATKPFSNDQNINPIYEGMAQFDNPLYDPKEIEHTLDDGFDDTIQKSPEV